MILDIGPEQLKLYTDILKSAGTILWNGPVGVFEFTSLRRGQKHLLSHLPRVFAFSVAGEVITLAAIEKYA